MFVRTKKIGSNKYAYLVVNNWVNGKTSQDSKYYLGRVFNFDLKNDIDFFGFVDYDVKKASLEQVIKDLVAWELARHDFKKEDKVWKHGKLEVTPSKLDFSFRKKPFALAFHDGFLAKKTVERVLNFKFRNDDLDAYHFAKCFVEAGMRIPDSVFVLLFDKLKRK